MSYLFTSDTHFFHNNVIDYCNRPYSSAEEMNQALVDNWNSVVKSNDVVFHLGDFAFKTSLKRKELKKIFAALSGTKILIKGNHDKTDHLLDIGFNHIYHESYITLSGVRIWMSHYPLDLHDNRKNLERPKAKLSWDLALHGHRHSKPEEAFTYDSWGNLKSIDVGVDAHNYIPVSFEQIKQWLG